MTVDTDWEAAQLAGLLTTFIAGIEDVCKPIMMRAMAHTIMSVDETYATLEPIVGRAYASVEVEFPWEWSDGTA